MTIASIVGHGFVLAEAREHAGPAVEERRGVRSLSTR